MKFSLFSKAIYVLLIIYWLNTLFFTLPDNYLTIKMSKYEKLFSTFFYQKWSFFAPPPKTNERLYYEFVNSKLNDTLSIEVLKPLNERRKKEYLLNYDASVIDYILSNSFNGITDFLREELNYYKSEKCLNINENECHKNFIKIIRNKIDNLNEMKTLRNYGLLVSKKNINHKEYNKFRVILTSIDIKKINEKNKLFKENETKIFETNFYNLNYVK